MSLCRKCGSVEYEVKWDSVLDMLDFDCKTCGFYWSTFPLDSMERAKEAIERPAVGKDVTRG